MADGQDSVLMRQDGRVKDAAPGHPAARSPKIYYASPLQLGPLTTWPGQLAAVAAMGFDHLLLAPPFKPGASGSIFLAADHDLLHPTLQWRGDTPAGLQLMARMARDAGLIPLLDIVLDRVAAASALAEASPAIFPPAPPDETLDPRHFTAGAVTVASLSSPADQLALGAWWRPKLNAWATLGFGGFRFCNLAPLSPTLITALVTSVHDAFADRIILGWTPGLGRTALRSLEPCGLDFVFSSLPWWNFHADWFWQEIAALGAIAPVIAAPEAPFERRLSAGCHDARMLRAVCERALRFAGSLGSGWMMPMGFQYAPVAPMDPSRGTPQDYARLAKVAPFDLSECVADVNRTIRARAETEPMTSYQVLSAPDANVLTVLRYAPEHARLLIVNTDLTHNRQWDPTSQPAIGIGSDVFAVPPTPVSLAPGQSVCQPLKRVPPITSPSGAGAEAGAKSARIAIERLTPAVDDGRFAVRRIVGEPVAVEADIICDGHDVLRVDLLWRAADASDWQRTPMRLLVNDRFGAVFTPTRLGKYAFTVEAWRDAYGTFRTDLGKKHNAGVATDLDVTEGLALIGATAEASLVQQLRQLPDQQKIAALLSDEIASVMARADRRPFATRINPPLELEAERLGARFAGWYEIFPRSMSDDEQRHGTFDDVIRHLPRIRDMGFDVLYFPPIHPIGTTNRKGRNNALKAGPGDPGSPYAIGSAQGGHTDIHPELGTLEDFRRLRTAASRHGLELALDFAIQCSPDHPWLNQHKDWFAWRPDGTIRYAENPPKRYEDIVNVDFYASGAIPALWEALRDVVRFWVAEGVRIFRVDNPHTKPLPFWQWLIADIKSTHPDTIFLAEAFTKPKMMYRLAKVGFNQSYTYFTWRNTKVELSAYLTELTESATADIFRPNFFVNTPDINPPFLQVSGRPGFLIRAALATTLSGLWGVYSGFELCEGRALPGREEYADSEKYQLRAWDWDRPGNIVAEISQLNWLRRSNPALQTHLGVTFLPSSNDQILFFEKATPDRSNVVMIAITLDAERVQQTELEVPLWRWQLPDDATLTCDDLIAGGTFSWHGKMQTLRLDPASLPYAVWRVTPAN